MAARITAKAKKEAIANIFKPAFVIVNKVLLHKLTDAPCPGLPKSVNLIKAANHLQQRLRPTDDFLREDIKVSVERNVDCEKKRKLLCGKIRLLSNVDCLRKQENCYVKEVKHQCLTKTPIIFTD